MVTNARYLPGWHLPRGLANSLAYKIWGADALGPHIKGWKPISRDLGRSALSRISIALAYFWLRCTEQRENILSVWTPRSHLFGYRVGVARPTVGKWQSQGNFFPNCEIFPRQFLRFEIVQCLTTCMEKGIILHGLVLVFLQFFESRWL